MTTTREFDGSAGMDFGVGYDSATANVKGDCVIRTPPESLSFTGQEILFQIYLIEEYSTFINAMGISLTTSMKGTFGGSSKSSYALNQKINKYSIFYLVSVRVTNATKRMRDTQLKEDSWKLLDTNPDEFYKRCGDEFLTGITSGGEFFATVEIVTQSEEEKQKFFTEMKTHGLAGKIGTYSAGTEFKNTLEKMLGIYQHNIMIFQRGGEQTSIPVTADDMIKRAVDFPCEVVGDKAYPYLATFLSYESLPHPSGPTPISRDNQKYVIELYARKRLEYLSVIADIEYVLSNQNQFETFDSNFLTAKANEMRAQINRLIERASLCFSDYQQCPLPDDLIDPVVELPKRKPQDAIDAVKIAKEAANAAASDAEIAKQAANKVLDVKNRTTPGPNGPSQAALATVEVQNAQRAVESAQKQVQIALKAKTVTADAAPFANQAELSLAQAQSSAANAKQYANEAHAIGYAPYWNGPTEFTACNTGRDLEDFGVLELDTSKFIIDPNSEPVMVHCEGSFHTPSFQGSYRESGPRFQAGNPPTETCDGSLSNILYATIQKKIQYSNIWRLEWTNNNFDYRNLNGRRIQCGSFTLLFENQSGFSNSVEISVFMEYRL